MFLLDVFCVPLLGAGTSGKPRSSDMVSARRSPTKGRSRRLSQGGWSAGSSQGSVVNSSLTEAETCELPCGPFLSLWTWRWALNHLTSVAASTQNIWGKGFCVEIPLAGCQTRRALVSIVSFGLSI
jgi:hypothetical protein